MSGFLYFAEMKSSSNDSVNSKGLGDRLPHFAVQRIEESPSGKYGILLTYSSNKKDYQGEDITAYIPNEQVWEEFDSYWIGYWKDKPPTPADLERDELVNGHKVRLQDGNEWIVPVVRSFPEGTALPSSLKIGKDGTLVTQVLPKYVSLCDRANTLYEWYHGAPDDTEDTIKEKVRLTDLDILKLVYEALALNYRVTERELGLLNLITTYNIGDVLRSIIDWPTFQHLVDELESQSKKKGAATQSDT